MFPAPSNSGLRANSVIRQICEVAGIKDLRAKVIGSHHPLNTVKAAFKALAAVRDLQELGRAQGVVFREVPPSP